MKGQSVRFYLASLLIIMPFFIVGFILVTQFRTQKSTGDLANLSEQELGQIVKELTEEISKLRTDVATYRIRLMKYQQETTDKKLVLNEAALNLNNLKILVGITKVTGAGISLKITDSRGILQSYDLLDMVTELRSSGAEAIGVNGLRVAAWSCFEDKKGKIWLDDIELQQPYVIIAIGEQGTLYQTMTIGGGILDNFSSLRGVTVDIEKHAELVLPPYRKNVQFKYALPVEK